MNKYKGGVTSSGMIFIPMLVKIRHLIQALLERIIHK
jgi:hypothetical protein